MFKVRRTQETVNKTLRFPKNLIEKMSIIAQNENVSLNSFVIQCCEYAIDNMQQNKDDNNKPC
ncbi:MAG: toxin-antitoxin system HicB family antitoxin [Clostridia bacterium]|nr:toxin-antitoxin system HicB family antitoxin [Clostridia bacterium]